MAKGTVLWFNSLKGYGFIRPDEGGENVFVNSTAVDLAGLETLLDDQRVSFRIVIGAHTKKPQAHDLRIERG